MKLKASFPIIITLFVSLACQFFRGQSVDPTEVSSHEEPKPTTFPVVEVIDDFGVSMVLVPTGDFFMGDAKKGGMIYLDAYYIDRYEVTNTLYESCVNAGVCKPPRSNESFTRSNYYGNTQYDDYPVIFVNWDMARTYCEWRGGHLPTEAEWEKAARGIDERTFPWGEGIDCTLANIYDSGNSTSCVGDTTKIGEYESGMSPYGVYDMAGNVIEWTGSLNKPYPYNPKDGREDLNVPGNRVVRGGSWHVNDISARSVTRQSGNPASSFYPDLGFRCARDATP